jgi:hypothetical protein
MLKAIEPETEAHPAFILLSWLTIVGNIVGRGVWYRVGGDTHYPNLFTVIVGKTSDAKGTSYSILVYPFKLIDPQ